jgi:hypothetical protein
MGEIMKMSVYFACFMRKTSIFSQVLQLPAYKNEHALSWNNKHLAWVLVELDIELGLPEEMEVYFEEDSFIQLLDYWREPFRCHYCQKIGHMKENCPRVDDFSEGDTQLDLSQDDRDAPNPSSSRTLQNEHFSIFDPSSFIGKMKIFYPSFFNSLSEEDMTSLVKNEDWIVDIFGCFWDLVLKKFEKNPSGVLEGECRPVPSVSSHVRPISNGCLSLLYPL